jgi:hypothetical protein
LIKYAVYESYIENKIVKNLYTNSYGVPVKYMVVHVEEGMPYCQKLTAEGDPVGEPECCAFYTNNVSISGCAFELDPDFTDAIILDSTEEYDPSMEHRAKRDTFKSVTTHNKASKVATNDIHALLTFLNNLNVGDTYWVSANNYMLVQKKELERLSKLELPYKWDTFFRTLKKNTMIPIITVADRKGVVKRLYPSNLHSRNIYTVRPRSYKEVKDLSL